MPVSRRDSVRNSPFYVFKHNEYDMIVCRDSFVTRSSATQALPVGMLSYVSWADSYLCVRRMQAWGGSAVYSGCVTYPTVTCLFRTCFVAPPRVASRASCCPTRPHLSCACGAQLSLAPSSFPYLRRVSLFLSLSCAGVPRIVLKMNPNKHSHV